MYTFVYFAASTAELALPLLS